MSIIVALEVGNLGGLVALILLIMFGPPLLFLTIGLILMANKKKKASKIFFILSGVYLLIGLGICGSMGAF